MTDRLSAVLGSLLVLAVPLGCGPVAAVRNIGSASGYSISLIDAVPKPGTALIAGQSVAFNVTVEYRLNVARSGQIVLVFEDQGNRILLPGRAQVSQQVKAGSGQAVLSDTLTVPSGVSEVQLFVPLVPEGRTRTSGELLITYPVRKAP